MAKTRAEPKDTLPRVERVSSGLYALLRKQDRELLDRLATKRVMTVGSRPRACDDALVHCKVTEAGELGVVAAGYAFAGESASSDVYFEVFPAREHLPDAGACSLRHVDAVAVRLGNVVFRCRLSCRRDDAHVPESQEEATERLAYAVLDDRTLDANTTAFGFCVQARLAPSRERVEKMLADLKTHSARWRVRYGCLQARRKYDVRSREATQPPYDVYTHELERVERPPATRRDAMPDTASLLLVPPCAEARACLMRKSLRLIDEQLVRDFVDRPGSANVVATYIADDRAWVRGRETAEEAALEALRSPAPHVTPVTVEEQLRELRASTGASVACDYVLKPLPGGTVRGRFCVSEGWGQEALRRFVALLLAHRVRVPAR
jgi:hypothetical protein